MSIVPITKTFKDGATPTPGTFAMELLQDNVTGFVFDAAAIWDPASQQFAKVGSVDQRLATASAPAVLTPVAGAQYNLSVTSAVALTVPATATHAYVTCDPDTSAGTYLRFTYDGTTTPTSSVGHTLAPGDADWFTALSSLKLFGEGGAVIVDVSYFKY